MKCTHCGQPTNTVKEWETQCPVLGKPHYAQDYREIGPIPDGVPIAAVRLG